MNAPARRTLHAGRPRIPLTLPVLLAVALATAPCRAQDAGEAARMSLDSLLAVTVHAAARYAQDMSDAPAAVTVVTADEITAHGYRTLAELLDAVAGFYISYDRNYTYVGVRGFSRPGDYNNRLLVMLNGRPMNEQIYGAVQVGTDLGIDLSALDRVEIVRGPVSALYGTSAMLAAVNLITRVESRSVVRAEAGSDGLRRASARAGLRLGDRGSAFVSAYGGRVEGTDLYFREFDDGAPGGGIAHGRDWDRYAGAFASAQVSGLSVQARLATRTKGVPTGAWSTTFDDGRFETTDRWLLLAAEYTRQVRSNLQLTAGAGVDGYHYRGTYPGDGGLYEDANEGRRISAEARALWDPWPALRMTVGATLADNPQVEYRSWWSGEANPTVSRPFRSGSLYLQHELQVVSWLSLTAGARMDDETFTPARVTPRLAAVVRPSGGTVLKALYGRAFRSPAMYEITASAAFRPNPDLRPERIRAYELVAEQRLRWASLRVSLFDDSFSGLIDPVLDPVDSVYAYTNHGTARTRGAEAELTASRGGWLLRAAGSAQASRGPDDTRLTNSPAWLGRLAITGPLGHGISVGGRLRAESGRLTLAGRRTAPFAMADLNLAARLGRSLRASLLTRNLLDARYAYPGGVEHLQDAISQDGRKLDLRLEYTW